MFDRQKQEQKSQVGKLLLKRKLVNLSQLELALVYQQKHQVRLGEALIALGFINEQQLKSVLRKQYWIRSLTAGMAVLLTPFTPAFAASQGSMGSSSTASSQISLTIPHKTITNSPAQVTFSKDNRSQLSAPVCTSNLGVSLYHLEVEGSGKDGAFILTDQDQNELHYQVAFQHQNSQFQNLTASSASAQFQNASQYQDKSCADASGNRLKLSLKKYQQTTVYSGYITVTIAAE